ncbi:MAG: PAS domain-containing protein [Saccharofermentans sp.]|nr:PAS domain-containing protein [Saccharofermentans sp.]
MNTIRINVFCNLSNKGIEDVLKTVGKIEGAELKFCDMIDDAVGFCLLITESVDEAMGFRGAASSKSRIYSVYICNSQDSQALNNRSDFVDDIWPLNENANVTKSRFKKTIRNIVNEHNAWFFKNLYFTALDSIPEMSWCKDLKGRHHYVNKAFSETVHKSKEECEDRDHYYIWNVKKEDHVPGDLVCVDSEELVLKELRTLKLDETLSTEDGMVKLATYKSPVYNEFGDVIGTIGIAHDVTEFANAQRENTLLVESVPFPVVVVDANWKTVLINGTMRRLLNLEGPIERFDYLTWKKYFLTPVSEPVVNDEFHFVNQIFSANDNRVNFQFQINEQDITDVFGSVTGHIIIPRKLGPKGEILGKPANIN